MYQQQSAFNYFRIQSSRPIGAGGLGVVDEVVVVASNGRPPIGSRYARKRLNDRFAADPTQRARFEREIIQMKQLRHPRIVAFEGESVDGQRFYLMPVYARSLRDFLMQTSKVEWRSAASFCADVADALSYAHSHNCVHRDLKPENILLDLANSPHIADWGLGQFIHKDSKVLDLTHAGLGTEWYCALEQWATGDGTYRSDIYSLGMMLAEMIVGARFSLSMPGAGVTNDLIHPSDGGAIEINAIIKKMTSFAAHQRHDSMSTVAALLRRATQR